MTDDRRLASELCKAHRISGLMGLRSADKIEGDDKGPSSFSSGGHLEEGRRVRDRTERRVTRVITVAAASPRHAPCMRTERILTHVLTC